MKKLIQNHAENATAKERQGSGTRSPASLHRVAPHAHSGSCVDRNLFPMIYKSIFQTYPSGTSHFSNDIHLCLQIFLISG